MSNKSPTELKESLLGFYVLLEETTNLLKQYKNSSVDLLRTESINKIRRYGLKEYSRKFVNNHAGNISEHMKCYTYLKNTEEILKKHIIQIKKDINKLELTIKLSENLDE